MSTRKKYWLVAVILTILIICTMGKAFFYSTPNTLLPGAELLVTDGVWITDNGQGEKTGSYSYTYQIPSDYTGGEVLYIQSYYTNFYVYLDGRLIYSHVDKILDGFSRIVLLPEENAGQTLKLVFPLNLNSFGNVLHKGVIRIGNTQGLFAFLIKENAYAIVFGVLAFFLGTGTSVLGIYLRKKLDSDFYKGIIFLGLFILIAGVWVVTDSQLFLLLTERTAIVSLVSFLTFFSMSFFILQFTRRMMPGFHRLFHILSCIYLGILALYIVDYLFEFFPAGWMLAGEHLLMICTMILVLRNGFQALRHKKDVKLIRIMMGYGLFFVFNIIALISFYAKPFSGYSCLYAIGILCFIFCLADAACRALYEQLEKSAKLTVYTRLAYTDIMTEMGNRTAFIQAQELDTKAPRQACIVLDINNLKQVNDSLGHPHGDRLIVDMARCIKNAVGDSGKCYRIGGDEFVILLNQVTEDEVRRCLNRLDQTIREANERRDILLSAAIGYAWAGEEEWTLEELFQKADQNMYEKKQKMKNL